MWWWWFDGDDNCDDCDNGDCADGDFDDGDCADDDLDNGDDGYEIYISDGTVVKWSWWYNINVLAYVKQEHLLNTLSFKWYLISSDLLGTVKTAGERKGISLKWLTLSFFPY